MIDNNKIRITVRIRTICDPEFESLSRCWDLEADQSSVLAGHKLVLAAVAGTDGVGPLLQTQVVILSAGEHISVQLPSVEQLMLEIIMNKDDIYRTPTTTRPEPQSTFISMMSTWTSMSGMVTRYRPHVSDLPSLMYSQTPSSLLETVMQSSSCQDCPPSPTAPDLLSREILFDRLCLITVEPRR